MSAKTKRLLYAKTLDKVTGVLVDIVDKTNPTTGKSYKELQFASGETIQMPAGHRIRIDLFEDTVYTASWVEGKFDIVLGDGAEVDESVETPFSV